jgi:hypothetical protein
VSKSFPCSPRQQELPTKEGATGQRESSPGQVARVSAHRARLLRAPGPWQDQGVPGLLLGRRRDDDLRRSRGPVLLRSGSPREREAGRGRENAAGVDADPPEGEPREEDEPEEEPAERLRHLRRRQRQPRRGMIGFEQDLGDLARGDGKWLEQLKLALFLAVNYCTSFLFICCNYTLCSFPNLI